MSKSSYYTNDQETAITTRIVENFIIVWLDLQQNELDENLINQFRQTINSIYFFSDTEQCIEYISRIQDEQIFMVIANSFDRQYMPAFEQMSQLNSIYFLSIKKIDYKEYKKVKGNFNRIENIFKELKLDLYLCQRNLTPISMVNSNSINNFNELDESFLCSQLIKEISVSMKRDENAKKQYLEFCRVQYAGNEQQLKIIDQFEREYTSLSPIWWYTRDCFTYSMLNKALRKQDTELIIRMGFFIRDLNEQIEQIYAKMGKPSSLTVYRGQGMAPVEFEKLLNNKSGLLSFNNFFSASTDRQVSLSLAKQSSNNLYPTSVLFQMNINPLIATSPFAYLDKISYYSNNKKGIIFPMHTIFRIDEIKQIEKYLWQINLTLTSSNDEQLVRLTEYTRVGADGETGMHRMAKLMLVMKPSCSPLTFTIGGNYPLIDRSFNTLSNLLDDPLPNNNEYEQQQQQQQQRSMMMMNGTTNLPQWSMPQINFASTPILNMCSDEKFLQFLMSKDFTTRYAGDDDQYEDNRYVQERHQNIVPTSLIEQMQCITIDNDDNRLKLAAANERRQATRHFGKVSQNMCWCAPLPVKPRAYSINPPSLSNKIFLGGIPHDLNERELATRLSQFGPVRIEWPAENNRTRRRTNHGKSGYAYAIFDKESSVHELLLASCQQPQRNSDGRCEYYLNLNSQRSASKRKSIQLIPWFTEDAQWMSSNRHDAAMCELLKDDPYKTTVFVGALHGMMTAYALARIFSKLFGEVDFAAIDTDRNKYPIGSGRVIFTSIHSYFSAMTANYVFIDCERFSKVIQLDPYLVDAQTCSGTNGQSCTQLGKYFCRSLACWKYFCDKCWTRAHTGINSQQPLTEALAH
ncbi:unnamed protein product, partial [Rotaria socialis]